MYPKNAASPERLAVGAVVLIADGTVQTSGVSISVIGHGDTTGAGGGSTAYENGVVLYTPTQAETNYTSFVVTAYKASCLPASITVVTGAGSVPGVTTANLTQVNGAAQTATLDTIIADTLELRARLTAVRAGYLDALERDDVFTLEDLLEEILGGGTGTSLVSGGLGATGNDTTHLHLDTLTYGDDELNGLLIRIQDNASGEYHSRWIEDWVLSTELATVATLPFTPSTGDLYVVMTTRRDVALGDVAHGGAAATIVLSDYSDFQGAAGANPFLIASGTIGSTGNDTTHLHLTGLTQGNDELNDLLIVVYDDSASEYHSAWIADWVLASALATVATLPFVPEDATDTYVVLSVRRDILLANGAHGGAAATLELSDYSDFLGSGTGMTPLASGTAQSGAASSITLAAGASAITDGYQGCSVGIIGGTGAGQSRIISGYNGSSKQADVRPNWVSGSEPDATSTYEIQPANPSVGEMLSNIGKANNRIQYAGMYYWLRDDGDQAGAGTLITYVDKNDGAVAVPAGTEITISGHEYDVYEDDGSANTVAGVLDSSGWTFDAANWVDSAAFLSRRIYITVNNTSNLPEGYVRVQTHTQKGQTFDFKLFMPAKATGQTLFGSFTKLGEFVAIQGSGPAGEWVDPLGIQSGGGANSPPTNITYNADGSLNVITRLDGSIWTHNYTAGQLTSIDVT